MALYFETQYAGGGLTRLPLDDDLTVVVAKAGAQYRIATDDGNTVNADGLRVTRTAQDLYMRGLPGERVVTIQDFFLVCRFETACQLQLDSLGGAGEVITPLSSAFATGDDGLLLWAAADGDDNNNEPDGDDDDDETSVLNLLLTGGLGVAAVGALAAGTGSGDDSSAVASNGDSRLSRDTNSDNDAGSENTGTENAEPGNSGTAGTESDDNNADGSQSNDSNNGSSAAAGDENAQNSGSVTDVGDDDTEQVTSPEPVVSIGSVLDNEPAGTGWFGPGVAVNDPTPVITGSVTGLPDGAAVQLLRDDELLGLTAVDGNQWAFTDRLAADGLYNYEAIVTDAAGTRLSGSNGYPLLVDTSPPPAPTLDPVTGDNIVMPAEAQGGITLVGTAEPGARVSLAWGDESRSVLAGDDGNWSLAVDTAPSGITVLQLVAEDQAQNRGDTLTRVVQVVSPTGVGSAVDPDTTGGGSLFSSAWLTGQVPPTV